jgi:hypothetical protein
MLHSLYRAFRFLANDAGDETKAAREWTVKYRKSAKLWQKRAFAFANALFDPKIQKNMNEDKYVRYE